MPVPSEKNRTAAFDRRVMKTSPGTALSGADGGTIQKTADKMLRDPVSGKGRWNSSAASWMLSEEER